MKFSTITAFLLVAVSTVFADEELYFNTPSDNSVFHTSDSVKFVIDEMSMGYTDTLKAELYNAEGESVVKNIGEWTGSDIEGRFEFSWTVDVEEGSYFVRVTEIDGEDGLVENTTRSYTFKIESGDSAEEASVNKIATAMRRRKRSIHSA